MHTTSCDWHDLKPQLDTVHKRQFVKLAGGNRWGLRWGPDKDQVGIGGDCVPNAALTSFALNRVLH